MNKYKAPKFNAYFIDLDGTSRDDVFLYHSSGYFHGMSKKNKAIIIETNKKTPVIISTGRDKYHVEKLLPELNIKYGICQNGAIIIDNKGKIIKEITINKKIAHSLIQFAQKHGLAIRINSDKEFYGGGFIIRQLAKIFKEKNNKSKITKMRSKYIKITLFGNFKNSMTKILKEIEAKKLPISVLTSARGYGIEITDKKATKGAAAIWICSLLKIDPKKAVHIGDTMNDTPAFRDLGNGIAMANSSKEVKQFASFITTHYRKNGLVNALKGNVKLNKNKIE